MDTDAATKAFEKKFRSKVIFNLLFIHFILFLIDRQKMHGLLVIPFKNLKVLKCLIVYYDHFRDIGKYHLIEMDDDDGDGEGKLSEAQIKKVKT